MVFHITELRNQIFRIFKMVDAGQEVTIIKKDSNKRYKIVPVQETSKEDVLKVAEEMGNIGFKAPSIKKMKRIFETRYE